MSGISWRRARACAPPPSIGGVRQHDSATGASFGKQGQNRKRVMTPIRIDEVSKNFGTTLAVDKVRLEITAGELFFLLGPSGCGKTTLLRMLAGFVQPDAGEIYFGDQRVTNLPARARDAGMVFQTYALWPHMTVASTGAYGLQGRGLK